MFTNSFIIAAIFAIAAVAICGILFGCIFKFTDLVFEDNLKIIPTDLKPSYILFAVVSCVFMFGVGPYLIETCLSDLPEYQSFYNASKIIQQISQVVFLFLLLITPIVFYINYKKNKKEPKGEPEESKQPEKHQCDGDTADKNDLRTHKTTSKRKDITSQYEQILIGILQRNHDTRIFKKGFIVLTCKHAAEVYNNAINKGLHEDSAHDLAYASLLEAIYNSGDE